MHVDRLAVGAAVVPIELAFVRGNNDRGRSDRGHDTIMLTCKLARSVANAPNARASTSVKLGC